MLIIAAYLSPFSIHETLIFLFPGKYRSPVKKIAVKAYSSIRKVFGSLLSLQKNTIQKYLDRINHNPYSSGRLQRQMQRAQAQAQPPSQSSVMGCADKPFYYQPKTTYMQPNYLENSYCLTYCA